MTPYPRLALGAHIQFETNGLLFLVLGILLLKLPHTVGTKSIWVMLLSAWGTWFILLSGTTRACGCGPPQIAWEYEHEIECLQVSGP
jgi:hypothetical protein